MQIHPISCRQKPLRTAEEMSGIRDMTKEGGPVSPEPPYNPYVHMKAVSP